MRRLLAIGFVWLGCAVAWTVLGSTLLVRSGEVTGHLGEEVHAIWGPPLEQRPPSAYWARRSYGAAADERFPVPLAGSEVEVKLALSHRQKGLLWFSTYGVDFASRYTFENNGTEARLVTFTFPLDYAGIVYDGFRVADERGERVAMTVAPGEAKWTATLAPGERRTWSVAYRSRGTDRWSYALSNGTGEVRDFRLRLETDFSAVDFPAGSVSPTEHGPLGAAGWAGTWRFESLVAATSLGVELPRLLDPGPLASRITFFAPVALLFFFFVVAVLAAARGHDIHPINYFYFGAAFFAFHLLFAYLVDQLPILPSFALASAVSLALVVSYARLFVGWTFALREIGLSQLVFLVLFSRTFFWQGFTGLAITVGAILTLFVMMQLTGRVSWKAKAGG